MKAREVIKLLKADGWEQIAVKGSHYHFKHPVKPGKVTIPFHGKKDLKIKTVKTIVKTAGLE